MHVSLAHQLLDCVPELLAGPLDVPPQLLFVIADSHRRAFSLIVSTSAFTLPTASCGTGGVPRRSRSLPSAAVTPATASSTAPMISAASQADRTPAIAITAHAISQPTP